MSDEHDALIASAAADERRWHRRMLLLGTLVDTLMGAAMAGALLALLPGHTGHWGDWLFPMAVAQVLHPLQRRMFKHMEVAMMTRHTLEKERMVARFQQGQLDFVRAVQSTGQTVIVKPPLGGPN
jgi:hypothetical protein